MSMRIHLGKMCSLHSLPNYMCRERKATASLHSCKDRSGPKRTNDRYRLHTLSRFPAGTQLYFHINHIDTQQNMGYIEPAHQLSSNQSHKYYSRQDQSWESRSPQDIEHKTSNPPTRREILPDTVYSCSFLMTPLLCRRDITCRSKVHKSSQIYRQHNYCIH